MTLLEVESLTKRYGSLVAVDNLSYFGGLYGLRGGSLATATEKIVDLFDLGPLTDRRVKDLNVGQQKLAHLATAVIHDERQATEQRCLSEDSTAKLRAPATTITTAEIEPATSTEAQPQNPPPARHSPSCASVARLRPEFEA